MPHKKIYQKKSIKNFIFLTLFFVINRVSAASRCDFDIDVFYNSIIIDAKSLLGVLSMDLTRELTVKYGGKKSTFLL